MACTLDRRYLAVAQTTDGQGIPQTLLCTQILKGELVWSPARFDAMQLLLPSVSSEMEVFCAVAQYFQMFGMGCGTAVTLGVTISFRRCGTAPVPGSDYAQSCGTAHSPPARQAAGYQSGFLCYMEIVFQPWVSNAAATRG